MDVKNKLWFEERVAGREKEEQTLGWGGGGGIDGTLRLRWIEVSPILEIEISREPRHGAGSVGSQQQGGHHRALPHPMPQRGCPGLRRQQRERLRRVPHRVVLRLGGASVGGSGHGGSGHGGGTTRRDAAPRDSDSVASTRRGAQSGDAKMSKTRTRRRIMTNRVKEKGPRDVARTSARTTTTSRRRQQIDVAMIIMKK